MILLLALTTLAAAQQPPALEIRWRPAVPRQGSLVELTVPRGDSSLLVFGELRGEPLHFERQPDGSVRTLAAVPLQVSDTVSARLLLLRGGIVEAVTASVVVAARRERGERLRAAPRFTPEPDAALQGRLQRERALMGDAARRAHEVPRLWTAPFVRPREARVTSPFGAGREVNGVWRSTHGGLDLAGQTGAPVYAANRGVVALVGHFFYGGISVFVHHGAGLMTLYQHLSRPLVAVGDTVARGQMVGRVGATGRVTGPHLHWEAHYGRIAFDPDDLLTLSPAPYPN